MFKLLSKGNTDYQSRPCSPAHCTPAPLTSHLYQTGRGKELASPLGLKCRDYSQTVKGVADEQRAAKKHRMMVNLLHPELTH